MLCEASACAAEDAEGPGFVEDEAEFVAVAELDLRDWVDCLAGGGGAGGSLWEFGGREVYGF